MMNYKHISRLSFTALLVLVSACKETPPEEQELVCENEEIISYQERIVPILEASCNIEGCHSSGFGAGDFTTFEGVVINAIDGSLLERIADGSMPPIVALSDAETQAFVCWIENGHQNN